MNYVSALIIGYLIGSFPTAYILLKKSKGIDITKKGSGNVGAMNSFEASKSKLIGITVLIIDALKGWLSAFVTYQYIEKEFTISILGLLFAIIGHCYSPWIKFKGGRGLATAAGGAIFISLPVLFLWLILWLIFYSIKKDIHFGNVIATFLSLIIPFLFSKEMIFLSSIQPKNQIEFPIFVSLIMIVILSKHIEPIKSLLINSRIRQ